LCPSRVNSQCKSTPELITGTLLSWAEKRGLAIQHIQPGKPQQNAYIERYNRTVPHEWLGQYLLRTIEEVKDTTTDTNPH